MECRSEHTHHAHGRGHRHAHAGHGHGHGHAHGTQDSRSLFWAFALTGTLLPFVGGDRDASTGWTFQKRNVFRMEPNL